jgi:ATP-dependent helicase HrpA
MPTANKVCKLVTQILEAYQATRQQLLSVQTQCSAASKEDVQSQLDSLFFNGFLIHTPYLWLQEMPRYLRALLVRLEKLAGSPGSDDKKLQLLLPYLREYERVKAVVEKANDNAEVIKLRWMLEEYRVSLFAQPMKTAMPVSPKRIEKQIALCA